MSLYRKEDLRLALGLTLSSVTLNTHAHREDLSVLASLELKAPPSVLEEVRALLGRNGKHPCGSHHSVAATVGGKELLQLLLNRITGVSNVTFPPDWELDVQVRETWPRKEGVVSIELISEQDPDSVAILLGSVGISHEYEK